jgi:hypothetical protein
MKPVFTAADIEEFCAIWREEFGEEVTHDRALAEAENLLSLIYQLRAIHERALRRKAESKAPGSSGFDLHSNATTSSGRSGAGIDT